VTGQDVRSPGGLSAAGPDPLPPHPPLFVTIARWPADNGSMPFPAPDLAGGAALIAGAALAPLVIALLARRRALTPGRPADQAWFGYAHLSMWMVAVLWAVWPVLLQAAAPPLGYALARSGLVVTTTGILVTTVAPLLLATLALGVLGQDVSHRLRGESVGPAEGARLALLQIGAIAVVIAAAGAGTVLFVTRQPRLALLACAAGVTAAAWLSARHRRLSATEMHAVTAGPLRDRLFALAAAARVPLRALFVVPMARRRVGNAFAVRGDTVIVTDVLLSRLSRREVDAVMAHEIAHLSMSHPRKLAFALSVPVATGMVALWIGGGSLTWVGPLVIPSLLVMLAVARRFEYAADASALELSGDPESLIRGLARIGRINAVPIDWSHRREFFLTHPSTLRRIGRIAALGGVAADRLGLLLADQPPEDGYELPPALVEGGKVFSSTLKRRILQRLTWARLAAVLLPPAAVFTLAGANLDRGTLFAAALLIGFLLLLLIHERAAARGVARLEAPLRARYATAAVTDFVSLAPGAGHRVYEGFFDWDLGLLHLTPERLEYRGEEIVFALAPSQVTSIEVVRGPAAWIPGARVQVTWRDGNGVARAFQIRSARVDSVSRMRAAARTLHARLEAWRTGAPMPAMARDGHATRHAVLPLDDARTPGLPPTIEAVSGDPLARVTSPGAFAPVIPWLLLLSAAVCGLAGLPFHPLAGPGWLDLFGVSLGATLLAHLPYWMPARAGAPVEEPRPARAA
jgi:heat shock protein HtpX